MAKKKPTKTKKPAAGRKAAPKAKKKTSPSAARKTPATASPAADGLSSLGRPKVTGDEQLYLLFREDYHARQIFEFLKVQTVRELERYSAGEILRRLSNPIKQTLERIRCSLAERNRCLVGDEQFALEHKAQANAK